MNLTSLLKKVIVASVLGLSLISTQMFGSGANIAPAAAAVSSQAKATKAINFAYYLKGKVRYVYGVRNQSRMLFDCSSFTEYVFQGVGVDLKWGTRAQAKQGKFVSKKNLKPGDLIFFSVSTPGRINHVGIYVGNGKFIHNTKGKTFNGVLVSNLSQYNHRYITARRVL